MPWKKGGYVACVKGKVDGSGQGECRVAYREKEEHLEYEGLQTSTTSGTSSKLRDKGLASYKRRSDDHKTVEKAKK